MVTSFRRMTKTTYRMKESVYIAAQRTLVVDLSANFQHCLMKWNVTPEVQTHEDQKYDEHGWRGSTRPRWYSRARAGGADTGQSRRSASAKLLAKSQTPD